MCPSVLGVPSKQTQTNGRMEMDPQWQFYWEWVKLGAFGKHTRVHQSADPANPIYQELDWQEM